MCVIGAELELTAAQSWSRSHGQSADQAPGETLGEGEKKIILFLDHLMWSSVMPSE